MAPAADPFLPRGHPPFPLPREGEGTEGEREIPPPGDDGGTRHVRRAAATAEIIVCRTGPPKVEWGPGREKTIALPSANRERSGMNGARSSERRA